MKKLLLYGLGILLVISLVGGCSYSIRLTNERQCQALGQLWNVPYTYHWFWGCQLKINGIWYYMDYYNRIIAGPGPVG